MSFKTRMEDPCVTEFIDLSANRERNRKHLCAEHGTETLLIVLTYTVSTRSKASVVFATLITLKTVNRFA